MTEDTDLVDSIYEAAVIPERWTDVLHRLTALSGGAFASMFILRDGKMSFIGTPEAEKLIREYQALGKPDYNTRITRSLQQETFGFVTDFDIMPSEEIEQDSFYLDFMRPRGFGWIAGAWIKPPSGELINFGVEGYFDRGPFQVGEINALNEVFPHLSRAALWSSRLQTQRAEAMAAALSAADLPAAVIADNGELQAANKLFEELIPDVVLDTRLRVTLSDPAAKPLLADCIDRLAARDAPGQSRSIPIAAREGRPPLIFHVIPVRRAANDIFARALAIVVVTPVDRNAVPTAEVLRGLFDFTPAEARVARGIAGSQSIDSIALASGVSRETIRSQLAAVLAKTGLSRQSELVALLSGKGLRQANDV